MKIGVQIVPLFFCTFVNMGFYDAYKKWQQLDELKMQSEAVKSVAEDVLSDNKAQLKSGKTRANETIKPHYFFIDYAKYKQTLNATPGLGNPDLFLTGSFYRGFKSSVIFSTRGIQLSVYSTDKKAGKLSKKYKDIFGLTPSNFNRRQYEATKNYVTRIFATVNT